MRTLYTILYYIATPFLLLRLWWRSFANRAYRYRWRERFAYIPEINLTNSIWLHAVSLGETLAAVPLINALLQHYPQHTLVVTTTTPTGSSQVKKFFGERVYHVYAPFDLPHIIKRFLKQTRPVKAIMLETELWPNQLYQLRQKGIPVLIANARLSLRSFQRYQKLKKFLQPLLEAIHLIAAQSQSDADRFHALGIKKERILITGNIKFDIEIPSEIRHQAKALRTHWADRPTLIAASTHEGEEKIILDAFTTVRQRFSNALLILVPRHPERFDKVNDLCRSLNFSVARRQWHEFPNDDTAIYLGDTVGDLLLLYSTSDVAFIGGSLTPVGGHNLIEPAAIGLPIITGPHLHNFITIRDLLQETEALMIVNSALELANTVSDLFADTPYRNGYSDRALMVSQRNRGAITKHLEWILQN